MPRADQPIALTKAAARAVWLKAQRLDSETPFGEGPQATAAAIEHLGYVQIDTIHVIERCHHHILWNRIPAYRRTDLHQAQSIDKSIFEYWTHALSYVPAKDFRFFVPAMKLHRREGHRWFKEVKPADLVKVMRLLRKDGALTIRDIEDDVLVEKVHPWASRNPSKRALQLAFYEGRVTISERNGMVKTYELIDRHFGWPPRPRAASEKQIEEYLLDRALTAQGLISGPSVMHPKLRFTPGMARLIETRVRTKRLVPVTVGDDATLHYVRAEALETPPLDGPPLVHILSPFDPLVIQRRRLKLFFGYDHVFEAYVPKAKRQFGYFTLPVLIGDEIIAALDIKADRMTRKLLIQSWHWIGHGAARPHKKLIEAELDRFAAFQFGD